MKRKIKISSWVAKKNDPHVFATGIYHDKKNGVAIATDLGALVISKTDYNEQNAGKVVKRNGEQINCHYPDYKRLFKGYPKKITIDREMVAKRLQRAKEMESQNGGYCIAINVGDETRQVLISPKNCKRILDLPKGEFIRNEATYSDRDINLQYESADGNYKALFFIFDNPNLMGHQFVLTD